MSALRRSAADGIIAGDKKHIIHSGQPKACFPEGSVYILNIRIGRRVQGNGSLPDGQRALQLGEVNVHSANHGVHLLGHIQLQLQLVQLPVIMGVGGKGAHAKLGVKGNQLRTILIK